MTCMDGPLFPLLIIRPRVVELDSSIGFNVCVPTGNTYFTWADLIVSAASNDLVKGVRNVGSNNVVGNRGTIDSHA